MADSAVRISIYRDIIDQLVSETRMYSALAKRAEANEPFPVESEQSAFNRLLSSLTREQRTLLSETLLQERHSAIHDTLAALTWWIDSRGIGLTVHDQPMPVDLSGMGLHGDYVGRADGWEWPSDEA
ncbi:DUF6547 family protein [Xanthomonas arboricola]|uniref:DUF6547 family protein n=1 Tax=Xanthomonas arboricola TaxID=56448 RepID=UPI003CCEA031